tara:strand:+ start:295 stop:1194 length:900 start_codon:yes stop_codon:yes gene_type:complete
MMINKMTVKGLTKKIILILFIIPLQTCSVAGQFWYDRLDIYLANYFFKYAEFSEEQKSYIRKTTKEFHRWNINLELLKYKNLLIEIKNLDDKTTSQDIKKIFNEGRFLFQESYNFFIPYMVTFCKSLTDKQIKEISLKFEKRIDKWESSLKKSKNIDPVKTAVTSYYQLSRFLGVKLTKTQKKELKRLYSSTEDLRTDSIEIQKVWNRQLISILQSRNKGTFNSEIKIHFYSLLNTEQNNERENVYYEMVALTITSLNEKQKNKFLRRINTIINSLDKIIKSQRYTKVDELEYVAHHGQ